MILYYSIALTMRDVKALTAFLNKLEQVSIALTMRDVK